METAERLAGVLEFWELSAVRRRLTLPKEECEQEVNSTRTRASVNQVQLVERLTRKAEAVVAMCGGSLPWRLRRRGAGRCFP